MEEQILRILKQRDEYPISIEMSNDNAKGETKLTIKARFESDTMTEEDLKSKVEIVQKVWKEQLAKAGDTK